MHSVRKLLSSVAKVALGGLGVVAVIAAVTVASRYPLRVAVVLLGAVAAAIVLGLVVKPFAPRVRNGTILELDLKEVPAEGGPTSKLAALRPSKGLTLSETVETLQRAAKDKRVAGLILRARFDLAPRTAIEELRDAIVSFKQSGKFTLAVADSFGEGGGANGAYVLSTACDEIVMQETGLAGLTPLSVEGNFYPDVLERLGIDIEVFGRGKYKSAPNRFTMKKFSPADREQIARLLESFWSRLLAQVAEARGVAVDELVKLADEGPQLAPEALKAKLIDRIAYPDEAISEAKQRVGKHANLLYLQLYNKRAGKPRGKGKAVGVAVIRAAGEIRRESAGLPIGLNGGSVFGPDTVVPHIRAAVKDKNVKAVVLRIDSPGGSALASDSIWRELIRVREAGKPLVASMASVAASGGYYIATPADKIVALPSTITGSIGVFGLRPMIIEAKKKLSVHTDEIHTGKEPPGFSPNRKLSRAQRKKVDEEIDFVYDTFLKRVGDGRNMAIDDVVEVAQGRVWTGADAREAGLVDELGGLDHAIGVAVTLTGASPGTRAKVKAFPKKASPLSALRRTKPDNSEDVAAQASFRLTPDAVVHAFTGVVAHLGFDPRQFWTR